METEIDIIQKCIKGDNTARKLLYEQYKKKLMGISSRYCNTKEQAQDVLQESFIVIFTTIHKYKHTGTFEGWMSRITINTAIKMNKKWDFRKSLTEINHIEIPDLSINPVQKLQHDDLLTLVQNLPTGYRTIFNLYVIDGYTHEEISNLLGISTGTSKSQLSRAKETLAKWIQVLEKKTFKYEQQRK
ncbi:MAG TPA: sigma-70 family RNA polymerase sigma factor [Bacteroidia bacterium]